MDLGETGLGDLNWIDLAQDRDSLHAVLNSVMKFWVL